MSMSCSADELIVQHRCDTSLEGIANFEIRYFEFGTAALPPLLPDAQTWYTSAPRVGC